MSQDSEIQGNIGKAFGRGQCVYLFVCFDRDAKTLPALREITAKYVVSAEQQEDIRKENKGKPKPDKDGPILGMFGLSASGYRQLGLETMAPASVDLGSNLFHNGFKKPGYDGWRPDLTYWDPIYGESDIHAFLLLAHDWPEKLAETVRNAKRELSRIGTIVAEEWGQRLTKNFNGGTNKNGKSNGESEEIEHFGFRDSMSSAPKVEKIIADHRDQSVAQPSGDVFGCYASFLKIEQHLLRFRSAAQELANKVGCVTAEQVQELAIGRQKNGEALKGVSEGSERNLIFDGVGPDVCPYHAHVRTMRDGQELPRIIRRGMAYGPDRDDLTDPDVRQLPPSAGAGLLFLSFQHSLFDFMTLLQRARTGLDPILSRSSDWNPRYVPPNGMLDEHGVFGQKWTFPCKKDVSYPMADMTTIRGGEYFFIPGMRFIREWR